MKNKHFFTIAILLIATQVFAQIPSEGLIGWYPFNDNANDESGNGNHGTVNGATLTTDRLGNENSAYFFDGLDDYIELLNINSLNWGASDFTISLWVNLSENTPVNGKNLISKSSVGVWDPYCKSLYIGEDNKPGLNSYGQGMPIVNSPLNLETWYHIVFKHINASDQILIYINGIEFEFPSPYNNFNLTSDDPTDLVYVAKDGTGAYFHGKLDDIRIYNRALNQSEITELYNESTPTNGLVAYWPFNGNANDESGNGNHGTVNGATLTTDRFGNVNRAYSFDGINDDIDIGNLNVEENWSISFWFYSNNSTAFPQQYFFNLGQNTYPSAFGMGGGTSPCTSEIKLWLYDGVTNCTNVLYGPSYSNLTWSFITVVKVGGTYYIYESNALIGQSNTLTDINISDFVLGKMSPNSHYFNGNIDDIRIYNRALNETEITSLFLEGESNPSECDFIENSTDWLNTTDITDASNILDNNQNTNGYLAMSNYSTTYTKSAEINFPSAKSISSFKFKYSFPATVESPCHGYPDVITHTCKIKLYYDNGSGWQEAYTVTDNLNTTADPSICEVIDSAQFDFSDVFIAQSWKIEMIGNYFLGASYQTTTYFKLFEVGFKECLESQDETMIIIPDTTVAIDQQLNIPVLTTDVNSSDNIISYQLNLGYDSEMLQFIDANVTGTIADGGIVEVNSSTPGQLVISYMTTTPLNGVGSILNLQFSPLQMGITELVISDFLYNTIEINNTQNGFFTVIGEYGDIDTNSYVQAFDAALALQYSVGMDPLPVIDPLPWEAWRIVVADVDGENGVTQIDANLILQYSVGSISSFPVEAKSQAETKAINFDVDIVGNEFVFTTVDELVGFNLYVANNSSVVLGEPIILDENMLSATKIDSETYNIGLCVSISPESETQIMKIPFTGEIDDLISFNMFINNEFKTVTFGTSATNSDLTDKISFYPNPVSDELVIEIPNLEKVLGFEIFNSFGQIIAKGNIKDKTIIKTNDFAAGVYILKITTEKEIVYNKLIKE